MKDVFISYSTKDQAAKNELTQLFDSQGITYWLDETSIDIGEKLDNEIEDGIQEARFTVLLVSENSLLSAWVSKESLFRLKQEFFEEKTTLLPVLLDTAVFGDEFPFMMYDKFNAEIEKQKNLRAKAEARNMKTALYNERIERLEEILPSITDIIAKITASLSANFADPNRKNKDLEKLLKLIRDNSSETKPETMTITKNITIPKDGAAGFGQTIVSMGGFLKMEQSTFKPRKILFICSSPSEKNPIDFGQEFKKIKDALQSSQNRAQFTIEIETGVEADDFLRLVMKYEPAILHISMYASETEGLYFESQTSENQIISPEELADIFALIQQKYTPELVVLSASNSLKQAQAIQAYTDKVVGMQDILSEQAGIVYAEKLYELIFDGETIEFAHNSAKLGLKMAKVKSLGKLLSNEIPVLISKGK